MRTVRLKSNPARSQRNQREQAPRSPSQTRWLAMTVTPQGAPVPKGLCCVTQCSSWLNSTHSYQPNWLYSDSSLSLQGCGDGKARQPTSQPTQSPWWLPSLCTVCCVHNPPCLLLPIFFPLIPWCSTRCWYLPSVGISIIWAQKLCLVVLDLSGLFLCVSFIPGHFSISSFLSIL